MQSQLKRAGQAVELIPDAPDLSFVLNFYYDAFFDLCTTRVNGMSMSPISVLSVDEYARNRQFTPFQLYFTRKVVRVLDPIYMEHSAREHKKPKGSKKSK